MGPAKQLFGAKIPLDDATAAVHRNDGERYGIQNYGSGLLSVNLGKACKSRPALLILHYCYFASSSGLTAVPHTTLGSLKG